MWEVRSRDDESSALIGWLLDVGLPALAGRPGYDRAEVCSGAEDRVVVLTWWTGESADLPDPPADLLARPAHSWEFASVGVR